MPTYAVTGPDGKKYRVSAPAGATEAEVLERVRAQSSRPKADTRPTSFLQGVVEGALKPLNNAARLLETGAEKIGVAGPLNKLGASLGMAPSVNAAERAQQRASARSPYRGSKLGNFAGNVVGTLPTAALPGGPFAQGAYATGLLTDSREPDKIAAEMLVGGLIGKGTDAALRGAAKKVAPQASKALRELTQRGVRVTPGQATRESTSIPGRMMTAFEDRATSLPGPTGQLARAGRQRASEDFVRGAVNESLGELGAALPKNIPAGNQAVAHAQKVAGAAYDDALKSMQLVPDQQLSDEITAVVSEAQRGGLSEPFMKQFEDAINNVVLRRANANGGNLAGDALKTTLSELNQKASRYSSSSVASEQEFGRALSSLADALEGGARRSSSPESVAALDAADRAYAKLVRVEGAAKNASGGLFTPGQLETAVRQADSSVRKRAVAAGNALMQDYATAGRAILPSAIGDSGTAGREAMWGLTPWLVDLAAYLPYRAAEAAIPRMATREPGASASALAQLLEQSAPGAAKLAPVAGYTLLNQR